MPGTRREPEGPILLDIEVGDWRGEILGSCEVNFGQVVQDGPPRQSIEFTYVVVPAAFTPPQARFEWPGILIITTPTPMKTELPDAGYLFQAERLPSLTLSLEVTRLQFSDMLQMFEANRLKDFHFTIEDEADGAWPVHSWGVVSRI